MSPVFLRCLSVTLFLSCLSLAPSTIHAEDFRLTDYRLDDEADTAELCLSFNTPLNLALRDDILKKITLEQNEKVIPLNNQDVTLTASQFCLQKLSHGKSYELDISALQSVKGQKLASLRKLSFSVPNRKPWLSFSQASAGTTPRRLTQQVKLESVNINDVSLTLYKISNPAHYVQAWNEFQQATLTPTESLTFAQTHGDVVWKSEKAFKALPNQLLAESIEIPTQPAGLYFLAAVPKGMPNGITINPKYMSGQWFIKSSLELSAVQAKNNSFVFAHDKDKPVINADVHLYNKELNLIGHGQTNSEGLAKIPQSNEEEIPYFALASTKSNDVAFALFAPSFQKEEEDSLYSLKIDQAMHQPGEQIALSFKAENSDGHLQATGPTSLRLVRPDHTIESETALSEMPNGISLKTISFPLSAKLGEWKLVWHQNGRVLSEQKTLLHSTTKEKIDYQVSFVTKNIEPDGKLSLIVRFSGKNAAYQGGVVKWEPTRPDLSPWSRFRFADSDDKKNEGASGQKAFIANDDGQAHINLTIPPNIKGSIRLTLLPKGRAPTESVLSFATPNGRIGVQQIPATTSRQVAFNLISLDPALKRQSTGPLYYQVYEEDRSFEWFQSEGRWNYHPLPQHRRIIGGRITLSAKDDSLIRIPATARRYVLEISDVNGAVLMQHAFQGPTDGTISGQDTPDDAFMISEALPAGTVPRLKIFLKHPSFISLVLHGKEMLQTIHKFFPAGESILALSPTSAKEMRLTIHAQATLTTAQNETRVITKTLSQTLPHPEKELNVRPLLASLKMDDRTLSIPVVASNLSTQKQTRIMAALIPTERPHPEAFDRPLFTETELDKNGRGTLSFASAGSSGPYKLILTAANQAQSGFNSSLISMGSSPVVKHDLPSSVVTGDKISGTISITMPQASLDGAYRYALTATDGLSLSGKTTGAIRPQSELKIPLTLSASRAGLGEIILEITGAHHFHSLQKWPLISLKNDTQSYTVKDKLLSPKETITLKEAEAVAQTFISPVPLGSIGTALKNLVTSIPTTPKQTAEWIETTRALEAVLTSAALASPSSLENLQSIRLASLLKAQNENGSFPALGSPDGDMEATAHVLVSLRHYVQNNPLAEQAALRAAQWIQKRLENPWFEESLRSDYATGHWALAKTGHSDVAMLRYFADTSRDKAVSPLTSAQIGAALFLNQDKEAATFWTSKAKEELVAATPESMTWSTLSLLAPLPIESAFFAPFLKSQPDATSLFMPARLQTLWSLAEREGTWLLSIDGETRKRYGAVVLLPREKKGLHTLFNASEKDLYLSLPLQTTEGETNDLSRFMQTHLYQLDGGRLNETDALTKDQIYIFELTGPTPQESAFIIQHYMGAGFSLLSPDDVSAEIIEQKFPWLGSNLTRWSKFKSKDQSVAFYILPSEEKDTDFWRVAYVVRAARSGRFTQQTATLHMQQSLGVSTKASEFKIQ